jgi:hypothetical protein
MRSYHQVTGILWSELLIRWTIYEELSVKKNLAYTKYPIKVLEIDEQVIWSKFVTTCKASWGGKLENQTTRESGKDPKAEHLHLFDHHHPNLEDEILLRGVEL